MADEQNYIDDFLHEKLGLLSEQPLLSSLPAILSHSHPVDAAIYENLSQLNEFPTKISFENLLTEIQDAPYPLEQILYEKLHSFQSQPEQEFSNLGFPENKKRKKRLFFWILMVSGIAVSYLMYSGFNKTSLDSKLDFPETTLNKQKLNQKENLASNEKKASDLTESTHQKLNEDLSHLHLQQDLPVSSKSRSNLSNQHQAFSSSRELQVNIGETSIGLPGTPSRILEQSFKKQVIGYDLSVLDALKPSIVYPSFKNRLTKIGFNFNIGYLNEINQNKTQSDQLHKHAIQNFQKSSSETRKGIQLSFLANYPISQRFNLRSGIQYSYSSVSQTFNYIYDELAVYDTTGQILGYFKRPTQQSAQVHEPVISRSQTMHIPFLILYRVGSFQGAQISIGGGADLVLLHQFKSKVFSFETEAMKVVESAKKQAIFQSRLVLMYEKRINRQMFFNISLQHLFGRQSFQSDDINYKNRVFSPSINFGITYYPLIKLP